MKGELGAVVLALVLLGGALARSTAIPKAEPVLVPARVPVFQQFEGCMKKITKAEREKEIKVLVDRFLMWPLPKSVCSDTCVSDKDYKFPRSGTNLLTADEARQMIEHLIDPTAGAVTEKERRTAALFGKKRKAA